MPYLIVIWLDSMCVAWAVERKKISNPHFFPSVENLLSSSLWEAHKNILRMVYVEREHAYTLCDLKILSFLEKIFFRLQRIFVEKQGSVCYFKRNQALLFDPVLPSDLKEEPLLKIASLRIELLETVCDQRKKENPSLSYYFHPLVGLWQFGIEKTLLFHNIISPVTESELEKVLEKSQDHMKKMGVEESIQILNLSSCFTFPPIRPSFIPYSSFSSLHGLIAMTIIIVLCIFYNLHSISVWERELSLSQRALVDLKIKTETPAYRKIRAEFFAQER